MVGTPLKLGRLEARGFSINRSGVRWLCEDGHICRPREVIGFCNISIEPNRGFPQGRAPFSGERELQVAFAPRFGGRLRIVEGLSHGGHLDALGVAFWSPDAVIGYLEPLDMGAGEVKAEDSALRLLMLAGRRMTGLAEGLSGLLPGWHSRARGWWCDNDAEMPNLLSLGICDALGPVRGDQSAFLEMFEGAKSSAHIISVASHPVAPCAPCLVDQFTRTSRAYQAISEDIMRALSDGPVKATSDDWLFIGALLAALESSPLRGSFDLLTPKGLRESGCPNFVLLSLNAEGQTILRHKKLGYRLHVLRAYQSAAGPATQTWIESAFEPARRTLDDIRHDYLELIDTVGAETQARFLILNRMSTSGREDIATYAPFDAPMGDTLANVASKELNLVLHDIASMRDITIIDMDAIAAEIGGAQHVPDGIHQSGLMEARIRSDILTALQLNHSRAQELVASSEFRPAATS